METDEGVENIMAEEENADVENKDPAFLTSTFLTGKFIFEEYGWYIVIAVILLALAKSWLAPYINKWRKKREDQAFYSSYDDLKSQQTFEAMQKARDRMQRENDFKTEIFLEQEKKREEIKRQQRLERLEGKSPNSAKPIPKEETEKPKPKPKSKSSLSASYNPLIGGGGGAAYRPSRRSTYGSG